MSKVFFDTNILIYTMDNYNPENKAYCRGILKTHASKNEAVISTQVVQEFYVVGKTKFGLEEIHLKSVIRAFENMEIVNISMPLIYEAIDTSILNKISFWDALIVVAAESAKCDVIYTEDLNQNQVIRNVKIVNPFKSRFC